MSESEMKEILAACLTRGLPLDPMPDVKTRAKSQGVPHAPIRSPKLTEAEFELAITNALRYFPAKYHRQLAPEFIAELREEGHIYMRRFRPTEYKMKAYPAHWYPAKCEQAAAIMHMVHNNLDPAVAQYPEELITYGGNGSVLSNWAQYHLLMLYLSQMSERQTLTMFSGHPMGLFPSHKDAPRVVVTNGMVIPNYSSKQDYDKLYALGCSQYGQMTAGSYCYIGPQGIVHGTTITILNAGRKYLGVGLGKDKSNDDGKTGAGGASAANADTLTDSDSKDEGLAGKVYVSSGLGGMSGAQAKAGYICGAVTVIAEVDPSALYKRHEQGWVNEVCTTLEDCIARMKKAREEKRAVSIGFLGNIVALWEALAEEKELLVELGSDQTSLHNPYNGGYYPVQLSFEEAKRVMAEDPPRFKQLVQQSLQRHVAAVNKLTARGMRFWDYGNSFLLEASKAQADIMAKDGQGYYGGFRYPSYVQEFMGDIFSLGFGPFRWVCLSGSSEDLRMTDRIAAEVMQKHQQTAPARVSAQLRDNMLWIDKAEENEMVVGSQARILYADEKGRREISLAFNEAIQQGKLKGQVVLSRDHHDVSGTDSPYRETSNIYDGSAFTADMAIHNVIGDSFRGATWVAIHNGGGCGWGEVMNGGFGLVLDGSADAARRAAGMLNWDVNNGVARRAWAGNDNAQFAIERAMQENPLLRITRRETCDPGLLKELIEEKK